MGIRKSHPQLKNVSENMDKDKPSTINVVCPQC